MIFPPPVEADFCFQCINAERDLRREIRGKLHVWIHVK